MSLTERVESMKARRCRVANAVNEEKRFPERVVLVQQFQYLSIMIEYAETHGKLPPVAE